MKTTFTTKVLGMGNNTGIEVPPQNIAELGAGKKPAVKVNLSGYAYLSTVGVMSGKHLIPLSAAHRKASGLNAGDEITVTLELETEARTVEIPADLARALEVSNASAAFDKLAPSKRKEFVRQLEDAKTPETRERRLAKILEGLD
jgi:uncharacterized protein YdeI (YjbR/CyaY-like superfamily)